MAGSLHVTGSEEPARNGNFSRFEVSTISLALREAERQMLVVENRDGPAIVLENPGCLAKELVAGIENLPLLILGVVAVFADDQHGVNGQFVAAAPERLGNRGIDLETKIASAGALWSSFGLLVDIKCDDVDRRPMPFAFPGITDQETGRPCAGHGRDTARRW